MTSQGKTPTRRHRARARVLNLGVRLCHDCERPLQRGEECSFCPPDVRHDDLDFPRLLVFVIGLAIGAGMVGIAWGWS